MWHVAGQLHKVSLRYMRLLMRCSLLLPPRPHSLLKVLYTVILSIYLAFVLQWRFSFNYHVIYDYRIDRFSRAVDLVNFVALITSHYVVAMELIWRNRSEEIEHRLQHVRYALRVHFGFNVNLKRIRRYCNAIYGSLAVSCLLLLGMTVYDNFITDTALLLFFGFYSEMVLLLRVNEFSLYSSLIFAFYLELRRASLNLVEELQKTRLEIWTTHRLLLDRLAALQALHASIWNTIRIIETNFELSLILIFLKYFVDTSVLPYWMYVNVYNHSNFVISLYCATEELCKLLAIFIPCMLCTRCDHLQRQLRSLFHGISVHRQDPHLNYNLLRVSAQFGQEKCRFSAGGLLVINNETLGKFVFTMVSYIVICIQFQMSLMAKSPATASTTDVLKE